MIQHFHTNLTPADARAVSAAVSTGWVGPRGPLARRLADRLAELLGRPHVVLTNSGSSALEAACRVVFDDGPVSVTSWGPAAVWNAIVASGRRIIPMPVGTDGVSTFFDPRHVNCLGVDLNGIDSVGQFSPLRTVEDACQALGADGVPSPHADAVVVSFSAQKIVTGGQGGAAAFASGDAAGRAAMLVDQGGLRLADAGLVLAAPSRNLRMTEMQAALILSQLDRLDETRARCNAVDDVFREALGPAYVAGGRPPYQHIVRSGHPPNAFVDALAALGIEAKHPIYRRLGAHPGLAAHVDWPAERAKDIYGADEEARFVALPFGPGMTVEAARAVVDALRAVDDVCVAAG